MEDLEHMESNIDFEQPVHPTAFVLVESPDQSTRLPNQPPTQPQLLQATIQGNLAHFDDKFTFGPSSASDNSSASSSSSSFSSSSPPANQDQAPIPDTIDFPPSFMQSLAPSFNQSMAPTDHGIREPQLPVKIANVGLPLSQTTSTGSTTAATSAQSTGGFKAQSSSSSSSSVPVTASPQKKAAKPAKQFAVSKRSHLRSRSRSPSSEFDPYDFESSDNEQGKDNEDNDPSYGGDNSSDDSSSEESTATRKRAKKQAAQNRSETKAATKTGTKAKTAAKSETKAKTVAKSKTKSETKAKTVAKTAAKSPSRPPPKTSHRQRAKLSPPSSPVKPKQKEEASETSGELVDVLPIVWKDDKHPLREHQMNALLWLWNSFIYEQEKPGAIFAMPPDTGKTAVCIAMIGCMAHKIFSTPEDRPKFLVVASRAVLAFWHHQIKNLIGLNVLIVERYKDFTKEDFFERADVFIVCHETVVDAFIRKGKTMLRHKWRAVIVDDFYKGLCVPNPNTTTANEIEVFAQAMCHMKKSKCHLVLSSEPESARSALFAIGLNENDVTKEDVLERYLYVGDPTALPETKTPIVSCSFLQTGATTAEIQDYDNRLLHLEALTQKCKQNDSAEHIYDEYMARLVHMTPRPASSRGGKFITRPYVPSRITLVIEWIRKNPTKPVAVVCECEAGQDETTSTVCSRFSTSLSEAKIAYSVYDGTHQSTQATVVLIKTPDILRTGLCLRAKTLFFVELPETPTEVARSLFCCRPTQEQPAHAYLLVNGSLAESVLIEHSGLRTEILSSTLDRKTWTQEVFMERAAREDNCARNCRPDIKAVVRKLEERVRERRKLVVPPSAAQPSVAQPSAAQPSVAQPSVAMQLTVPPPVSQESSSGSSAGSDSEDEEEVKLPRPAMELENKQEVVAQTTPTITADRPSGFGLPTTKRKFDSGTSSEVKLQTTESTIEPPAKKRRLDETVLLVDTQPTRRPHQVAADIWATLERYDKLLLQM